jgi:hypothetical protein
MYCCPSYVGFCTGKRLCRQLHEQSQITIIKWLPSHLHIHSLYSPLLLALDLLSQLGADVLHVPPVGGNSTQASRQLYAPPVIGGAAQRQQEAEEAAGGIVFGRDEGDEVQADPIARDTAALEQMEAAADGQVRSRVSY